MTLGKTFRAFTNLGLLVFSLSSLTVALEPDPAWISLPRRPSGEPGILQAKGRYLLSHANSGYSIRKMPSFELVREGKDLSDCQFGGRFLVCGSLSASWIRSGEQSLRFIDFDSGNEEREIVGLSEILKSEVEMIREDAKISGLEIGSVAEISNLVVAIDQNGHAVLNVQFQDRSMFLSTRDSVLENGKLEKRWVRQSVTKAVDRFGIWLSPSSLNSPYDVTHLAILNNVVYARGAEGPFGFARSVDSGRTWMPVSIFPVVDQMTTNSDTIVAFPQGVFSNDSIFLSIDNGATWKNTGMVNYYKSAVYFRDGFGWVLQNAQSSVYLFKFAIGSKDLKVVVAGQLGKSSIAITDYGIAVLDDLGNGKFWESSLGRWKSVELSPVQLGVNKARFHQGDLHVFQGSTFGNSRLLKYNAGKWDLVASGIQDFDVRGDHLFAIGSPKVFEDTLLIHRKIGVAWHRPIVRLQKGGAWDTLYQIQTSFEKYWDEPGLEDSKRYFPDRIGLDDDGSLRVIFNDSGNYLNRDVDTIHSLFSVDGGITWRPSRQLFQGPFQIDPQWVQLDELGYLRMRMESNSIHPDLPQSDVHLFRGRLDFRMEIGQQYRIESISPSGRVSLLFEGLASRAGNHSFEIPKTRTLRFLRVRREQQSRTIPAMF